MSKIFHNLVEAGGNHPIVTGVVGVISSMFGKIFLAVTDSELTIEIYDDWSVRVATTVGILVSLLTIYILLNKVWEQSKIIRPFVTRQGRKMRVLWYRKSLYIHQIKQFFDR